MSNWHRATIEFQNSPKSDLNYRSTTSVTTQVYGNTESAAMEALRKIYRSWDKFVIIGIEWRT